MCLNVFELRANVMHPGIPGAMCCALRCERLIDKATALVDWRLAARLMLSQCWLVTSIRSVRCLPVAKGAHNNTNLQFINVTV